MYIVFTGMTSWISFFIGLITWSFARFGWLPRWMSHGYIVIDDTCYEATAAAGKALSYPVSEKMVHPDAWEWRVNVGAFLPAKVVQEAKARLDQLVATGTMYDFEGAAGYLFNQSDMNRKDKVFCYELITTALPIITTKDHRRAVGRHLWRGIRSLASAHGLTMQDITVKI